MFLLRVAPIGRGMFTDELHYFTSERIPLGAIVSVPVRRRTVSALVLESIDVRDEKTAIKSYPYAIKKIGAVKSKTFLLPLFIELAHELSNYYVGSLGSTLAQLVPHTILERGKTLSGTQTKKDDAHPFKPSRWEGPLALQGTDKERHSFYRSRIREGFARHMSVFVCLPTIRDIEQFTDNLDRGVREYTIILHSKLSKKELENNWKQALKSKHPILIVGTGQFLSLPREDIGIILLDKENSPAYKMLSRPYIDFRLVAERYAQKKNASLVLGDVVLRTETVYRKEAGKCHYSSRINYHVLSQAKTALVDMKVYKDKKPFVVVSDEAREVIQKALDQKESVFVFSHRKGLSTFTVCDDCGSTQLCKKCDSPLVLYKKGGETIYACHKCGAFYSTDRLCTTCDSWRLTPLGVGIDKVHESLKKTFPKVKIFVIDSERIKNHTKGVEIADKFKSSPGTILLGTEMSFFFIRHQIDTSVIASIDSFFSLPDFRVKERALNILMRIKTLTKNTLLIQTRNNEWPLYEYVKSGNLVNFYRDEIEERSTLKYPPVSTLIKITLLGEYEKILDELNQLSAHLRPYKSSVYPAFTKKVRGKDQAHLLLKLKPNEWPNETLHKKLKSLPPEFRIVVDPSDLL